MEDKPVIVPRSFIDNNTSFIKSRVKFFSDIIQNELFEKTMKDFNSAEFLHSELITTIGMSQVNIDLFRNFLQRIKLLTRRGNLIDHNNPSWMINSQVDYLTTDDTDFLEDLMYMEDKLNTYRNIIEPRYLKYHCGQQDIEIHNFKKDRSKDLPLGDLPF